MASSDRRTTARRKAWGRGPMILRFDALEQRQLLTTGLMNAQASAVARPDLVLTAFDTVHNLDHGEPFQAVGQVSNLGGAAVPAGVEVDVYASTTTALNAGAVYVGTATVSEAIPAGGTATFREVMQTPPVAIPGLGNASSYFFVAKVDPENRVNESNETNNGGSPIDPASPVTLTTKPLPVLSPGVVTVSPGALSWGDAVAISGQFQNNTSANIAASRARVVIAPEGSSLVGPEAFTVGELALPGAGVSQFAQVAVEVDLPERPPAGLANATRFHVGIIADAGTVEAYLGASTVQIAPGVPLAATQKPDLTVSSVQPLDTDLSWSVPFRVKATIENTGGAASGATRVSFLLVDAARPEMAPLAISQAIIPALEPGYAQEILQTIDLNGKVPQGLDLATVDGRILVRIDPDNMIDEANEGNNDLRSSRVTLKLLTRDGRTEVAKPGPITTRSAPATPPPAPVDPPAPAPAPRPNDPAGRPTREAMAERASMRRALVMLRVEQARQNLRVFRDRAHHPAPQGPHLPFNPPTRPRAS